LLFSFRSNHSDSYRLAKPRLAKAGRGYAKSGEYKPIKDFAAATDKAVKMHLKMAQKMADSMKTSPN
jgi:hypothetical protein